MLKHFNSIIEDFENRNLNKKELNKGSGVVYTPIEISDYMVRNLLDIFIKNNSKQAVLNIKILDPSCGTGRFLLSIGNYLFEILKDADNSIGNYELKKSIIENNIYGIEIDEQASQISKIRLIKWLFTNNDNKIAFKSKIINRKDVSPLISDLGINFNIFTKDFLLDIDSDGSTTFDIIIGNPPYVENKKIEDSDYKKSLYREFDSAYKLFDLSILFIEKSLRLLKPNKGLLSFILTNKFLAAEYGIKIREIILNQSTLLSFLNISSLPVFKGASTYPIIMTLRNKKASLTETIKIQKFDKFEDFSSLNTANSMEIPQKMIIKLPGIVIPLSGNLNLIQQLYSNLKQLDQVFEDLKIIYRPYGFTKWAKFFKNISNTKKSENDLILLGTGNLGKYYIKSKKRIKIAKTDIPVSFFNYIDCHNNINQLLRKEKLVFREIAKDLTFLYDPGIFTNITGLYFLQIPSLSTEDYYGLLTIFNSTIMDTVFKTLFGTLHMSGGYLRCNGSFIKRLPMVHEFPLSLSYLGIYNQLLSQLFYNLQTIKLKSKIKTILNGLLQLTDGLVNLHFLSHIRTSIIKRFPELYNLLIKQFDFPKLDYYTIYNLTDSDLIEKNRYLYNIESFFEEFHSNLELQKEMKSIKYYF
ncbi:MAG: HsdM family class I SAM-dependent methyltransferase [Promethearchaeota archaeon]